MKRPGALGYLDDALAKLDAEGLLRQRREPVDHGALSFCSNDYLGLAALPAPPEAGGAGASRLIDGERTVHRDLETAVSALVGAEDALVFSSGYAANLGLLGALTAPGDLIVSDALNHASIIDGARLSRARVDVVPHLDLGACARALRAPRSGRAWLVTESYFSMDADAPDLAALRSLCDETGAALVVDEAHALGVLGPEGRGLCAAAGIAPDVLVGTFGKAFGAAGAFVAGSRALTLWLWNRARSFVFSTGLGPSVAAAALRGVRLSLAEPERRHAANDAAARLRGGLRSAGVEPAGFGHIVPWIVGSPARACAMAEELRRVGLIVGAIRPPSVPAGTARLRLTVTARHTPAVVERAVAALTEVACRAS